MIGPLNYLSAGAPLLGILLGLATILNSGRTDLASGIGAVLRGCLVMGAVCLAGEAAAFAAWYTGERLTWVWWVGVVVNGLLLIPALLLLLRATIFGG